MQRGVAGRSNRRGLVPGVELLAGQRPERLHRLPAEVQVGMRAHRDERSQTAREDELFREDPTLTVAQVQGHQVRHLTPELRVTLGRAVRRVRE